MLSFSAVVHFTNRNEGPSTQHQRGSSGQPCSSQGEAAAKCIDSDSSDGEPNAVPRRSIDVSRESSASQRDKELFDPDSKLADKLEAYLMKYAKVNNGEMARNMDITNQAKQVVLEFFRTRDTGVQVESVNGVGSAFEGLKVIAADEFDFALCFKLKLGPPLCLKELGGEGSPGYWFICDSSNRCADQLELPWKKLFTGIFDYGQILSPEKVRAFFQSCMQKAFNDRADRFTVSNQGPAWTIVYRPPNNANTIHMDFVPTIEVGGHHLVAKPHPLFQKKGDERFRYLWRESFSGREMQLFKSLQEQRSACQLACLQIMKAIRHNFPAEFGRLSSFIYKTVLLNMMSDYDSEDWSEDNLAEQFIDYLLTLSKSLHNGELYHYYVPELNLFAGSTEPQLRDLANFLDRKVRNNKVADLLLKHDVHHTAGQKLMEEASG